MNRRNFLFGLGAGVLVAAVVPVDVLAGALKEVPRMPIVYGGHFIAEPAASKWHFRMDGRWHPFTLVQGPVDRVTEVWINGKPATSDDGVHWMPEN